MPCGSPPTAGVPLIPVILWGTQRMMTKDHPTDFSRGKTIAIRVGEPLHPTGEDPVAETAELHAVMTSMLDEVIAAYPADEQPPGSWWLPASPRRQRADPGGGGRAWTPRRSGAPRRAPSQQVV